jgi:Xaa-Pro aminopeptidase
MILAGLLKLLGTMNLDVYFVPLADEHFNENLAPTDRRVNVLTGFSGTYGMAIAGKVNVFMTSFQFEAIAKKEIQNFSVIIEGDAFDLGTYLQSKGVKTAGINPKLILSKTYKQLEAGLNAKGITLTPIEEDLVDKIWTGKPKKEFKSILSIEKVKMKEFIDVDYIKLFKRLAIGPPRILNDTSKDNKPKSYNLNVSVTGESYKNRIKKIQKKLKEGQGLIVSDLDSIAWMTNLRGHDIDFAPSFFSFMYITKKSVKLFTGYPVTLKGVQVFDYNDFYDFLNTIKEKEILVSGDVNYEIYRSVNKPEYSNIILEEEVQKNNIELFGYKNAGVKDGVALVKLFAWIENNIDTGITELDIRRKMFKLKAEQKGYFSESFEPLVATGTNSARIYHKATNKVLQKGEILLLDTGTHYFHGTTDLTRTLVFGTPRSDVIKYYTIVLKSLLDAKFIAKKKIRGKDIEELARKYLREIGRDYPTMSGHGVGYFGQVHEKLPKLGFKDDKLRTFNTYTLEPTYFDEEMGIRIEDMVFNNRNKSYFYQTNLTYVPLDLKLIDPDELNDKQLNFLNVYSGRVREFLKPLLKDDKDATAYLIKNTEKLTRSKEYKPTPPKVFTN